MQSVVGEQAARPSTMAFALVSHTTIEDEQVRSLPNSAAVLSARALSLSVPFVSPHSLPFLSPLPVPFLS